MGFANSAQWHMGFAKLIHAQKKLIHAQKKLIHAQETIIQAPHE